MTKVIVVGSNGKIGNLLSTKLSSMGIEVIGITSKKNKKNEFEEIYFDWNDPNEIKLPKFNLIYYTSGMTNPYELRNNLKSGTTSNLTSFVTILESAKKSKSIYDLIYFGSISEYGNTQSIITENSQTKPLTFYENFKISTYMISKQMLIENWFRNFIYLRISNVYGFLSELEVDQRSFIDKTIRNAVNGNPIKIFGTGEYKRDFLHIEDFISLLVKILQNELSNRESIFNIASYNSLTIRNAVQEIARIVCEKLTIESQISFENFPTDYYKLEERQNIIAPSKATKIFDWTPNISFSDGVAKSVEHFRNVRN